MAYSAFAHPEHGSVEPTSWVSPSATPPSACLSSTTAARVTYSPPAFDLQPCASPPASAWTQQHRREQQQDLKDRQSQQPSMPHHFGRHQHHRQQPPQQSQQAGSRPLAFAASHSSAWPHTMPLGLQGQNLIRAILKLSSPKVLPPRSLHYSLMPFRCGEMQSWPGAIDIVISRGGSGSDGDGGIEFRQQSLKRPRQSDGPDAAAELAPLLGPRTSCLVIQPPSGSLGSSRQRLHRHSPCESDSDGPHSASSLIFAQTVRSSTAPATDLVAPAAELPASCRSSVPLHAAAATQPAVAALPCCWKQPCQMPGHNAAPAATARISAGRPVPSPLPSLLPPCAADGEEFILYTVRALRMCPDACGRLALHLWRRVGSMVRLALSIRHPAIDGTDPRVASSAYRIYATACLWLASKVEDQRRQVVEARMLAACVRTSASALCSAELRLLAWVEWSPLRDYLPRSGPQLLAQCVGAP